MSDSPAERRRKTDAMIERAKDQINEIGRRFVLHIAAHLIDTTPGPNLQLPETEYIATGRLRAGWSYDLAAITVATRWDGGPYTEHGEDTYQAIKAEVYARETPPRVSYLNNDVAYGYIVHEGRGRHPYPRPWVTLAAKDAEIFAEEARREVMGNV